VSVTAPDTDLAVAWEHTADDAPVALSAQADLVAVGGADGTTWILDIATGAVTGSLTLPGGLLDVVLSPDAAHLAVTGPTEYALWGRAGGQASVTETGSWSATAAWATTDKVAIACGRHARVLSTDGRQLWSTEHAASTVTDLAWMRDGRRLVVAAYGAVRCHERHTPKPVVTYRYVGSHLALAITPNGRWICSGNQDASIHIWRTRDGSDLTMSGYPEKVSRLAFDDTGGWLAADGAPDITVWDFSGKGPAGTAPRSLRCHENVTTLAWRPGSNGHLASGGDDGTLALWRATSGRPEGRLRPARTLDRDAPVTALAWAGPELLIAAYRDGRIRAHHIPSRARL
jgi:WD40 repeat protein